jgi:hypothetical protein
MLSPRRTKAGNGGERKTAATTGMDVGATGTPGAASREGMPIRVLNSDPCGTQPQSGAQHILGDGREAALKRACLDSSRGDVRSDAGRNCRTAKRRHVTPGSQGRRLDVVSMTYRGAQGALHVRYKHQQD